MEIALLIPDRGDRPLFLDNALRMAEAQTLQPIHIELVDDPPLSADKDITWRYRTGYDRINKMGIHFDFIALWENDDWYSPDYLKVMADNWESLGRPNIMGHTYTIYYHLRLHKYMTMHHITRSSAMNTIIVPNLPLRWTEKPPAGVEDRDPYTDMWLWRSVQGKVISPDKMICLGMKHGVGLSGGHNHLDRLERYESHHPWNGVDDADLSFLRRTLDTDSFDFYTNVLK